MFTTFYQFYKSKTFLIDFYLFENTFYHCKLKINLNLENYS